MLRRRLSSSSSRSSFSTADSRAFAPCVFFELDRVLFVLELTVYTLFSGLLVALLFSYFNISLSIVWRRLFSFRTSLAYVTRFGSKHFHLASGRLVSILIAPIGTADVGQPVRSQNPDVSLCGVHCVDNLSWTYLDLTHFGQQSSLRIWPSPPRMPRPWPRCLDSTWCIAPSCEDHYSHMPFQGALCS